MFIQRKRTKKLKPLYRIQVTSYTYLIEEVTYQTENPFGFSDLGKRKQKIISLLLFDYFITKAIASSVFNFKEVNTTWHIICDFVISFYLKKPNSFRTVCFFNSKSSLG